MGKRWSLWLLVVIVGWGIAVRSINLGSHAYWVDEVHTATRIAGYTKEEITATQFNNQLQTVAAYNTYQSLNDDRDLGDVLAALAQHPEHPPLYYLLVRGWIQLGQIRGIPQSVAGMRSLSVLFGILLLPAIAALGRELGDTDPKRAAIAPTSTIAIAVAFVALSPLHILYAQESREYSLWGLVTVLSCWSLLRAIRCRTLASWIGYGLILVVGWYSHLLFATVVVAQIFYVTGLWWLSHRQPPPPLSRPMSLQPGLVPMGRAIALSFLAFLPWVGVILWQFSQIQAVVEATQHQPAVGYLINVWGRNLSRVLVNHDLAGANPFLLFAVLASVFYLWRSQPWRVSGLILALIGVNALPLMGMDLVTGSTSSTRIRYLIPAYLGLQWAIAYALAAVICWEKPRWIRGVGQTMLVSVLMSGAIAGGTNLAQPTNWTKSDKAVYYPVMATAINQSPNPLVITDTSATYTLVLTAQLKPEIPLLLVEQPDQLNLPRRVNAQPIREVFLFDPSYQLQHRLTGRLGIELEPIVRQNERFQLLRFSMPYREDEESWRDDGASNTPVSAKAIALFAGAT
ncbi:MAG: glycosyltransferase family 39 protein [Leptolyngbyaceae cyanobacterium]